MQRRSSSLGKQWEMLVLYKEWFWPKSWARTLIGQNFSNHIPMLDSVKFSLVYRAAAQNLHGTNDSQNSKDARIVCTVSAVGMIYLTTEAIVTKGPTLSFGSKSPCVVPLCQVGYVNHRSGPHKETTGEQFEDRRIHCSMFSKYIWRKRKRRKTQISGLY